MAMGKALTRRRRPTLGVLAVKMHRPTVSSQGRASETHSYTEELHILHSYPHSVNDEEAERGQTGARG